MRVLVFLGGLWVEALVDGLQVAKTIGRVGTVFVALVLEAFCIRSCVISAASAGYTAVACIVGVVWRDESDDELMLASFGVGDDVLPFNGVMPRALREPGAVPVGCIHSAAVEAFRAEESVAGDEFPLVG